jgi:hypothetical protein
MPAAPPRGPTHSGKLVVFSVLALGAVVVGGIATFAALTRPVRGAPVPAESGTPMKTPPGGMGW